MKLGAALCVASCALVWAAGARAFCLSTTCKETDACDGEDVPGCVPLKWASGCVGYSVHQQGGPAIDVGEVEAIVASAFDQWRDVDCGGQPPGVVIQNLGQVECGAVEYNKKAGNANIVLFNSEWAHSETSHTFALTTTTFDPDTGELLNADIELNSRDHDFTISDEAVGADLFSILTHETGHFLGLGHSQATDATMFQFYAEGSTELRTLTADDAAGLCTLYPPQSGLDESCNPLQRHGFSPYCRDDQPEGSCAFGPHPGPASGGGNAMLLALAFVLRRSLRSRSERPFRSGCR